MPPTIVSHANCEVRAVIRFLSAKGVKPIDSHREIVEVYGQNIMSDGMVRKWMRNNKRKLDIPDWTQENAEAAIRTIRNKKTSEKLVEDLKYRKLVYLYE
ncbi:unnamed protein product [Diabrotica balteata]|uniref:Uncharacterized protein n=1 Tax=Diabrotica balteata TaxID=107213 RepID=A0A9N9SVR7_DIABA|nr:unnamed protein product [Diabrotica balteata]